MIHEYLLSDNSTILLCREHGELASERIVSDNGREQGGKWKCAVCTIHRRLTGNLAEPVSVIVCGWGDNYVVTRYPVTETASGKSVSVTYCTCPRWRFQRKPAWERWCKHCDEAAERLPAPNLI